MTGDERDEPAVIGRGGVYLPGSVCEPIWRVLLAELNRRRADGGRIRPDMARALDVLRAAALDHLTANGHDTRTPEDTGPPSAQLLTTADLAARLGVTPRHARRIAHREGITPVARNVWATEDAAALTARRATCSARRN